MSAGEAIAIRFAAGSACTLVITLVMLIKASRNRISVAATVLGIGRREAIQLDKEGRLGGAPAIGLVASAGRLSDCMRAWGTRQGAIHPGGLTQLAVMSPRALEVLRECRSQETG